MTPLIKLEDLPFDEVASVSRCMDRHLPLIRIGTRREYHVARSHDEAGKAARRYWEDMIENDPQEFTCIAGKGTLVAWALGQWASPGSVSCRSLEEWLSLTVGCPEEVWGGYDGNEVSIEVMSKSLLEDLGWEVEDLKEAVAYRCN